MIPLACNSDSVDTRASLQVRGGLRGSRSAGSRRAKAAVCFPVRSGHQNRCGQLTALCQSAVKTRSCTGGLPTPGTRSATFAPRPLRSTFCGCTWHRHEMLSGSRPIWLHPLGWSDPTNLAWTLPLQEFVLKLVGRLQRLASNIHGSSQ